MSVNRWEQVEQLFHGARALEEKARAAYLDDACDGDSELRAEVESLLKREGQSALPFEKPLLNLASQSADAAIPNPITIGTRLGPYAMIARVRLVSHQCFWRR